uniref:Uncharacterized protein n=1 Tax=Parascaris equorum TaxID=6256 RepID=A0A914RRZ9_PAREQ
MTYQRSRRKGDANKENGAVASTAQVGGKSATMGSDTAAATRKSPSEMGICDSFLEIFACTSEYRIFL